MSYFVNNQQKMFDIIFANRNKNYGAYAIRSAYGSTVFKSLSYMATCFCSLMGLLYYLSHMNDMPPVPDHESIPAMDTVIFDATPPEQKREEPSHPSTPPPTNQSHPNSHPIVTDSVPANTPTLDLAATQPSGTATGTSSPDDIIIPGGGGTETVTSIIVKKEPEKFPDAFPDPGYNIKEFLRNNIRYPQGAIEVGAEGTLYVRFVVDEDGSIAEPEVMNRLGYGLDEEGVRVVGKLPTFKKPGYKNNKPVKVYYQIPIRYKLN